MNSRFGETRSESGDLLPSETLPEDSPSAGWKEVGEAMHVEVGLGQYIDDNREDLEAIAEQAYPISHVVQALLDSRDRGEIEC